MMRYCVACGAERTGLGACAEHGESAMVARNAIHRHVALDTLARTVGTLTVQRDTFDAGQRVTVHGSIGRLPYLLTITRDWGDDETAEEAALAALRKRLDVPSPDDLGQLPVWPGDWPREMSDEMAEALYPDDIGAK